MHSRRTAWRGSLLFLVLLALLLSACERPANSVEDEVTPPEATTAADGAPTAYPAPEEGEETEAPRPDAGGETPAEGEEPAEGEGEAPAEGEQPAEGEAPAEGEEPAEGEGEAPAEGEGEAPAEGEEPAEEETPAEEEAPAEGEETAEGEEPAGETTHVVQPGENLYRIGLQYNVSWLAIAAANNIQPPYTVYVSQELVIPGPDTGADEGGEEEEITYTVQAGDNLYRIGQRYGVSYLQIAEANGIVNPNNIYAGQVLKIPTSAPGPSRGFVHTIQPGETLSEIAALYGVSISRIAEANGLEPPYLLFYGTTLVIPGD